MMDVLLNNKKGQEFFFEGAQKDSLCSRSPAQTLQTSHTQHNCTVCPFKSNFLYVAEIIFTESTIEFQQTLFFKHLLYEFFLTMLVRYVSNKVFPTRFFQQGFSNKVFRQGFQQDFTKIYVVFSDKVFQKSFPNKVFLTLSNHLKTIAILQIV